MKPIDVANKKSLEDFIQEYLPPNDDWKTWTHPRMKAMYSISLQVPKQLPLDDFEACFNLIDLTSSVDYKKSKNGWKPRSKKKEMKLLDLKYLLIKEEATQAVQGFVSVMPTYEDNYPVLYVYEIHLQPSLQGTGLGKTLMDLVEHIALKISGTEKIMLTCFRCNEKAVRFYEKCGLEKDEFSPEPKALRNGSLVECEYVILSKRIS